MAVTDEVIVETEEERNARALRHAIAQQALEGLTVSPETIEDMQRAASGEISEDEVIRNVCARYSTCPDTQRTTPTSTPNPGF